MGVGDILRFGLYAVTVALGIALVIWVLRDRRLRDDQKKLLKKARSQARANAPRSPIKAVRGLPTSCSMAEALAGIELPVDWQPDPPVEVASPLTLTTNRNSAGEMAELLTDELSRIGYRIIPTGATSADATRGPNRISIEIDAAGGSFVSSRLTLSGTDG